MGMPLRLRQYLAVSLHNLRKGLTMSCGCLGRERAAIYEMDLTRDWKRLTRDWKREPARSSPEGREQRRRAKRREQERRYRAAHPEQARRYRATHKEQAREQHRRANERRANKLKFLAELQKRGLLDGITF